MLCLEVLQKHKWENCMTLDGGSWGFRRNMKASDVLSMKQLTETLAETIRFIVVQCLYQCASGLDNRVCPMLHIETILLQVHK